MSQTALEKQIICNQISGTSKFETSKNPSLVYMLVLSLYSTYIKKFDSQNQGPSWLLSYGSWIYNYICNQCLSPVTLWVRILLRWYVLDTTLCGKVCQWLPTAWWFSLGTLVSSTNKTDHHGITEILLKVASNTINQNYILKVIISKISLYLFSKHEN